MADDRDNVLGLNGHAGQPIGEQPVGFASIALFQDGRMSLQLPPNEMMARFLIDRLRFELDEAIRRQNPPRDSSTLSIPTPRRIIG